MAKFSHVVVIGLRAATVTRPLMPCWTVAAAPTTAARTAGTTTAAVVPETRPPTATTTPTMARRAATTRATETGTRPAGPIPSLSTPTAVRVWAPTTAMVNRATPAIGTAYACVNTKNPPMTPPMHCHQRISPRRKDFRREPKP